MKCQRLFYLDYIRAVATMSIVLFHLLCEQTVIKYWPAKANFSLGDVAVGMFFILSGVSLIYTYEDNFSMKEYYKKRFMSIYILFWLTYFIFFMYDFFTSRGINESIPICRLIYSVLGIDGYISYKVQCFYLIGEWFLGCIIILYIVFPLLLWLYKKSKLVLAIMVMLIYFITLKNYKFEINMDRNVLIVLPLFVFGMYFHYLLDKLKQLNSWIKYIGIVGMILILGGFLFRGDLIAHNILICGTLAFLLLYCISKFCDIRCIRYSVELISKYSYTIFLTHHFIYYRIAQHFVVYGLNKYEMILAFVLYITILCIVVFTIQKIYEVIIRKLASISLEYNCIKAR